MAPAVRLLLLFVGAPAALLHAEPLPVANPSFEDFYIGPGAYRTGEIAGWSQDGGGRGEPRKSIPFLTVIHAACRRGAANTPSSPHPSPCFLCACYF